MSEASGALVHPLYETASRLNLRQYGILCKVLRLLPEAVDEEVGFRVETPAERIARHATPYVRPTVEEEEISHEPGRVWTRQLKTIDERLRWKLESDFLDIWGVEHVDALDTRTLTSTDLYKQNVLTNHRDAWIALNLIFARLNAEVQLKRTTADDVWGLDFKEKMQTFTHELALYVSALRADMHNWNPHDPQWYGNDRRPPHNVSNPRELQAHFMRLLICVFDSGLMRGATTDAYGHPNSWVRNPPLSDPSNWRNDIQNDAPFISWLTVAAWKVFAVAAHFSDPYDEYEYEGYIAISEESQKLRQEVRNEGERESERTLDYMTDLVVEMARANLRGAARTEKINFEYNRHYHTQLSALLKLLQPFESTSENAPPHELQALVMPRINAQIAHAPSDSGSLLSVDARLWQVLHTKFDQIGGEIQQELLPYCDIFYIDTIQHMGPWVAHHIRDWFCEFRALLIEMCVTIMKYKAAQFRSADRAKRHYRMVTLLMKLMAHMYDVPKHHTGNMSYQAYKDPLNKRLQYLKDKEWMKLLEDTAWIVFCANYSGDYTQHMTFPRVNPRVVSMIGAYRAALETREQKTPADQLITFAKAQTESEDPLATTRPATAPARPISQTPADAKSGADEVTRNALLELQALYTVQI
jgi:hypothetical protein